MPGKLVRFFSTLNPHREPEESIPLRVSVLAAIMTAEITILAMGYYDMLTVVAVPLLTLAGFAFSWRRRYHRNLLIKLVLSILVIIAAVMFVRRLMTSFYDTRLPLIELLLWLQVLHSFDLPARKELKFSLASGVTLIAAGAVLSTGMLFFAGLAVFSLTAVVSMIYLHLSEQEAKTDRTLPASPVRVVSYGLVVWIICLGVSLPLLFLMPQTSQARLHSLPFSNLQKIFGEFSGDVVNPDYPSSQGNPFDNPPQFNSSSYFGFNQYMDLRSRGSLSDEIVLKVRSDSYDYYRGMVFDLYNGKGWEMSSEETTEIATDQPPFDLDIPASPVAGTKTRIQSFYVQGDMPNIIFAAWRPVSLYFPANRIKLDRYSSLRSPFPLTEDTVYSVVSETPVFVGATLRRFPRASDPLVDSRYTDLPSNADLSEVARLTHQITDGHNNQFDKLIAIERYLKDNYRYDLEIPPQPEGMDAVAYFLFQEKAGYCEHFSSAMTVMARSIGIPARVVTGYAGGRFNPFTGLWEIRQNDAHAWVEVYYGAAGWVPYDPTPGFDVPAATDQAQSNWMAGKIIAYLEELLGSGPVGTVVGSAGNAFRSAASLAKSLPWGIMGAVALAAVALGAAGRTLYGRMTRQRRLRRQVLASLDPAYLSDPMLERYFELTARLHELGLIRRRDETLKSFARRVSGFLSAEEFRLLSEMVEKQRYGEDQAAVREDSVARAKRLAEAVLVKLKARSGRTATGPS